MLATILTILLAVVCLIALAIVFSVAAAFLLYLMSEEPDENEINKN